MNIVQSITTTLFILSISGSTIQAQDYQSDSTLNLKTVTVKAYLQEQPLFRLTTSIGHIDSLQLEHQTQTTLLPSLNTVPGVRMEERSPGSYRLSIRGSLLRSPFGVRNVKVYYDEIPLTDAGGNTYLNSLDAGSISEINILKGPDGSLFGANSGGVVLLSPTGSGVHYNEAKASLAAGSYGSIHQQVSTRFQPNDKYRFSINQSFLSSDGYRENSAMTRNFFQTVHRWNYTPNNEIRVLGFYSDMQYRTPGGLTAAQYDENPKSARLAAGPNPGAVEQKAGIYNKTLFGGIVHDTRISNRLKHVISIFGTHTDFENPFITNYEFRNENNIGFRTYFNLTDKKFNDFSWLLSGGMEWQKGSSKIRNYDNNDGIQGDEQSGDRLRSGQHFYFARFGADWNKRLFIEIATSLNYYNYSFRNIFPTEENDYSSIKFKGEWMPRLAFSYVLNNELSWRSSAGKGYSTPTTAEVRPSDNIINTDLQAETGWNYETGFRWDNKWFKADASIFYYKMKDAIVRQLRDSGAEFFNNAGSVNQRGLEVSLVSSLFKTKNSSFIEGFQIGSNLTLSKFKFGDYMIANNDFSGNKLTGVPSSVLVSYFYTQTLKNIGLYIQHNYTSAIPLNDANTESANSYHLLQAKVDYKTNINKVKLRFFFSVDNILNQKYSLGNDINAFGGRYFNAAPLINFSGGIKIQI